MAAVSPPARRWFFGPLPDLLFGCGVVYAVFFVTQIFAGPTLRGWLPLSLLPLLTLALGAPHYGATLLRVYARREERRRYAFFGLYATLALVGLYVLGLRVVPVGSFLVTLYFTWSPWHYTGQNYGLAVLFLRRRGIAPTSSLKRFLYGTFILSYALVLLSLHTAGPVVQQAPATLEGTVYHFLNLGVPRDVSAWLSRALLAGYAACLVGAAWCLRGRSLRALLPTATLVAIQAVWFLAPTIAASGHLGWGIEPFDPTHRPYAFMWIAVGHFVQYLWITAYYAASSGAGETIPRFLGKALLAGTALWTLPALLFAPGALGALPYDLGLGLLTGAVVNLHHFVLDGAIWKLRDGRVARVLLRPVAASPEAGGMLTSAPALAPARLRAVAWAAAALVMAAAWLDHYELTAGNRAVERGDLRRASVAAQRRSWLGGATPNVHIMLARIHLRRGDVRAALAELEAGRRIYPTAPLWIAFGAAYEQSDRPEDAARAYEEALALDPRQVTALVRSAKILERLGDDTRALERLERAAELNPGSALVAAMLESQRRRTQEAPR